MMLIASRLGVARSLADDWLSDPKKRPLLVLQGRPWRSCSAPEAWPTASSTSRQPAVLGAVGDQLLGDLPEGCSKRNCGRRVRLGDDALVTIGANKTDKERRSLAFLLDDQPVFVSHAAY